MLVAYLISLIVTIAIEVPIVAWFFKGQRLRMSLVCLVTTSVTHLAMHHLLPQFIETRIQWILIGEAFALIFEAAAYTCVSRPRSFSRALMASGLANMTSYAAGILVWP